MADRLPGLFIVGTDTGVGKTHIACWIVRWLRARGIEAGACKPFATGADRVDGRWSWGDIDRLMEATGRAFDEAWVGPFRWKSAAAPAVACVLDRERGLAAERPISPPLPTIADCQQVLDTWEEACDLLVVEGIGGLLCPLTERETVAELAGAWGRPILIVARAGLGTLNHTLLTVEAAASRGLRVAGIVLNRESATDDDVTLRSNPRELAARVDVPIWGPIDHQPDADTIPPPIRQIDWLALTSAPRMTKS